MRPLPPLPPEGHVRAACLAAALLAVLVGCTAEGTRRPVPWDKPATVEGRDVTLEYAGSSCGVQPDVVAVEDASRVVLTVSEQVDGSECSDVDVPRTLEVRLSAPLGRRDLVDGACQVDRYASYVQCQDP